MGFFYVHNLQFSRSATISLSTCLVYVSKFLSAEPRLRSAISNGYYCGHCSYDHAGHGFSVATQIHAVEPLLSYLASKIRIRQSPSDPCNSLRLVWHLLFVARGKCLEYDCSLVACVTQHPAPTGEMAAPPTFLDIMTGDISPRYIQSSECPPKTIMITS